MACLALSPVSFGDEVDVAAALRVLPAFSAAALFLSEQSLRHNTLITDGIIKMPLPQRTPD